MHWNDPNEVFNLDSLNASDLFGMHLEPAVEDHDGCEHAAQHREHAVTRALEEHIEPCMGNDLAAIRWVVVAEYEDPGGERFARLHAPEGSTRVDILGLLDIGKEWAT